MSLSRRGFFGLVAALLTPLPRAAAAIDVQKDVVWLVLPDGRRIALPCQYRQYDERLEIGVERGRMVSGDFRIQQLREAESLGLPVPEYRRLLREKLFRERTHTSGYRSTLKKLTVTMPTDAVLISSRRLQQLSDSEILKLVKSNSVAIIR